MRAVLEHLSAMKQSFKFGIVFCLLALALLMVFFFGGRDEGELAESVAPSPPPPMPADAVPPETTKDEAEPQPTLSEALVPTELPAVVESEVAEPARAPAAPVPPAPLVPEAPRESAPEGPFADSPAVRVQETLKIDPPMREIGRAWLSDRAQRTNFSMPVSGGRDLEIEVDRFEAIGEEGGEFIGTVKGVPGSTVRLSYRGSAEAGTIRLPSENRVYRILPGEGGQVVVQERNLAMDEPPVPLPPDIRNLPPVPNFTPPPPPEGLISPAPPGGSG